MTKASEWMRSNVLGLVAIVIALTMGTAYATHPGGEGTISTDDILNGAVTNVKIAPASVQTGRIQDQAVTNAKIALESITNNRIAPNAVNSGRLADEAVITRKLADGAVTQQKLAFAPWRLDGNAGTGPGDFLGTTDDNPLNFRVNDARALRIEPTVDTPNLIGGSPDNAVAAGAVGATISGGGALDAANDVTDDYGTVGGGIENRAGDGNDSTTNRRFATVGGGFRNTADGPRATIGGGATNTAGGDAATVAGGTSNLANGARGTVAGGIFNSASATYSAVGGGFENMASAFRSNVAGGSSNVASGQDAAVGGGDGNTASGGGSIVAGGVSNNATAFRSTALGGLSNTASGAVSTVVAGSNNVASGEASTIAGGSGNTAAGDLSLVAGKQAKNSDPDHDGAFLFADSLGVDFASTAANEFAARASGGFRFRTNSDASTGCNLPAGSGTFSCTSDRDAKRGFEAVDGETVMARLAELPITTWSFKSDPAGVRHLGPVAQDFHAAFGLGSDDTTISSVDADGVALAAIKALVAQNRELESRVAALERGRR
jgi:hypothetical protein